MFTATTTSTSTTWNGPICPTCGKCYLDSHACAPADLLRKAAELIERARQIEHPAMHVDRMATCPCRPENGGSGVCGCILGGPTIT